MGIGDPRPTISLNNSEEICNNSIPCRVVFHKNKISIDCTDITIEAAVKLLEEHREWLNSGHFFTYQKG